MTNVAQLRKDPRPVSSNPQSHPTRRRPVPSAHITPFVLRFLGLKREDPRLEKA